MAHTAPQSSRKPCLRFAQISHSQQPPGRAIARATGCMRAVADPCNRRDSPNPDAPRDQLNPRRPLASATSGGPDGPQKYQQTKRVMRDRRVIARVAACRHAARAALPAVRRQARMICDPQGSNEVNVQDGALVHKAPLRPVGRSCASALVSAKDQQCRHRPVVDRRPRKPDAGCSIHPAGTISFQVSSFARWRKRQTHRTQNAAGNTVGVQLPPRAPIR